MVLWLIMSLLDDFPPQKIEVSKLMRDIMIFLLLKENVQSIQSVLFSFTCYTAPTQKRFSISFIEYTIKVVRKLSSTDHTI